MTLSSPHRSLIAKLVSLVCLVVLPFSVGRNAAAQAFDVALLTLPTLAEEDPEAALRAVEDALIRPDVQADLRAVFDLNRLAADLLVGLGRTAEAAALLFDLGEAAARNRERLGTDPIPIWRRSADAAVASGDPEGALRAEAAILREQRDGALPPAVLASTLDRMASLADAMGDAPGAADLRAEAASVLAPSTAVDTRGSTEGFTRVEVFYATDRARSGEAHPDEFYGADRGRLEYGMAEVTVPDTHEAGAIEAPSVWRLEFGPNPARHIVLRSVEPLEEQAFFALMQESLAARERREAFVFIHGYNVSFDAAAKRAAQLAYDMNFSGLPVLYSWPSQGTTMGYLSDASVVQLSARRLSRFLDDLVASSGAETIHIVAHSMGNRALTEALELMALRRGQEAGMAPIFGQVIFAAPDVDADLFAEMLPTIRPLANRLTLYASENDWALVASRRLHGNAPRAGQGGEDTLAIQGIDSIDMSELGEDMLAHGYFADDSSALVDLVALFWRNLPPDQRCGLEPQGSSAVPVWRYVPEDCPDNDLLAVIGTLQEAGVEAPDEALATIEGANLDPDLLRELEPVVARMFEP